MIPNESLADLAALAATAPRTQARRFFSETAKEIIVALAGNPNLQEGDLLRLLERKDLPSQVIHEIASRKETLQSYTLKLALTRHSRTPRLISLPFLKFLHLFDLVQVSLSPTVPTDVKLVAEEAIIKKSETIQRGEKLTLARRSSGRVAAALLVSEDRDLIQAVLDNPFLTEAHVLRALSLQKLPAPPVELIGQHEKWRHRYHIRLALVRNPLTPLHRVLEFLPDLAVSDLKEICLDRRMAAAVRKYIAAYCVRRIKKSQRLAGRLA